MTQIDRNGAETAEVAEIKGNVVHQVTFLDASSHLYERSCLSVRRSVSPSVGRSVRLSVCPALFSCAVYPALLIQTKHISIRRPHNCFNDNLQYHNAATQREENGNVARASFFNSSYVGFEKVFR